MRKRGLATVALLLSVVVSTTAAAFAAPAQPPNQTPVFFGNANLNLGSLLMANFGSGQNPAVPHLDFGQGRNWDSTRDLFPAAASLNPLSLSASTVHSAVSFAVAPGVSFGISHVALGLNTLEGVQPANTPQQFALRLDPSLRNSGSTAATLNLNVTEWSQIGLTASRSVGNPSLLGSFSTPVALGSAADTSALGISARVGFAEGWVTTLAYSEGVSQLDLSQLAAANTVRSDAYGIGVAKTGLFGNDALGIAVSRPLQIFSANNTGIIANNFALATSPARESDVELGYVTSFLDGTLALQANAAYELNAAGARGQNALAAVARAKLSF